MTLYRLYSYPTIWIEKYVAMVTATKVPITNSISLVRESPYVVREDPDFDNPCLYAMILYTVLNLILRMEKNILKNARFLVNRSTYKHYENS